MHEVKCTAAAKIRQLSSVFQCSTGTTRTHTHTHTHTQTLWLISLQCPPLPPSSSLLFESHSHPIGSCVIPRCMPKQPCGHKPPPLSTHKHTITQITRVKWAAYSIVRHQNKLCVCDPACRATCGLRPLSTVAEGNPIRLIDRLSLLHNRHALSGGVRVPRPPPSTATPPSSLVPMTPPPPTPSLCCP